MARGKKPTVSYWDSRGAYCTTIKGTQHILAKGPDDSPMGAVYLEAVRQ